MEVLGWDNTTSDDRVPVDGVQLSRQCKQRMAEKGRVRGISILADTLAEEARFENVY